MKNADQANFVLSSEPWFIRGAAYSDGLNAGVFTFNNEYGRIGGNHSFRVVLYTIFKKSLKYPKRIKKIEIKS